jgi:hypothetical protein
MGDIKKSGNNFRKFFLSEKGAYAGAWTTAVALYTEDVLIERAVPNGH